MFQKFVLLVVGLLAATTVGNAAGASEGPYYDVTEEAPTAPTDGKTSFRCSSGTSHHAGGHVVELVWRSGDQLQAVYGYAYPGTGSPGPEYTFDFYSGELTVKSMSYGAHGPSTTTLASPLENRSSYFAYVDGLNSLWRSVSTCVNPPYPFPPDNSELVPVERYLDQVRQLLETNVTEVADLDTSIDPFLYQWRLGQRREIAVRYKVEEASSIEVELRDATGVYESVTLPVEPGQRSALVTLTAPSVVARPESLVVRLRVQPGPFSETDDPITLQPGNGLGMPIERTRVGDAVRVRLTYDAIEPVVLDIKGCADSNCETVLDHERLSLPPSTGAPVELELAPERNLEEGQRIEWLRVRLISPDESDPAVYEDWWVGIFDF